MATIFVVGFLILGAALLTLELVGIDRKQGGDTITEMWHWLDDRLGKKLPWLQWFLRVFTVGLLAWTALHFGGSWG